MSPTPPPPPTTMEEAFKILGIKKTFNPSLIKKAYLRGARKLHPDKNREDTTSAFQRLNNAYELLIKEIAPLPSSHKNETHDLTISFSLEELYNGCIRTLTHPVRAICGFCGGEGGISIKCPSCEGRGTFWESFSTNGGKMESELTCAECFGRKMINDHSCLNCDGSGYFIMREPFEVTITPGLPDGESFPKTVSGVEFIIHIAQLPHPIFSREGNNLVSTPSISIQEALSGYRFTITHLNGKIMNLQFGEAAAPGREFILPGEGFPIPLGGWGDMIFRPNIFFPKEIHGKLDPEYTTIFPPEKPPSCISS